MYVWAFWRGFSALRRLRLRRDFAEMKKYDYAHRGLHEKDLSVPENSMAGFKAAVEAGYGIEFDLQLTKDKKVVVHHDRSLKRVCGADVSIGDLTYKELQQYRLQNTEERVPLFSDVLALVDGRTPLIIELKHYDDADLLCPLVWELLRNYKGPYCVESFDPYIVQWFRKNHPYVLRGQLMVTLKARTRSARAFSARCSGETCGRMSSPARTLKRMTCISETTSATALPATK